MDDQNGRSRAGVCLSDHSFHQELPIEYEPAQEEVACSIGSLGVLQSRPVPVRILVVDDHAVVRHGTASWIAGRSQLRLVGEAGTATEAITQTLATKPDIVLLDIGLGGEGGLFAAQEIVRLHPASRIIAFSGSTDPVDMRGVLVAGARGYVLKSSEFSTILSAINAVLAGGRFLDPGLSDLVLAELELLPEVSRRARHVLTNRETQVLSLLASGHTYREIAQMLLIKTTSVNAHRKRIYDKLGLTSRAEAVRYAIASGLNGAPNKRLPMSAPYGNLNSTAPTECKRKAV